MQYIIVSLLALLIIPVLVITGTAIGAITGMIVGLFFDDTLLSAQTALGITNPLAPWELGASLAFVGGFLRTTVSK